jgi:hypothetical protein
MKKNAGNSLILLAIVLVIVLVLSIFLFEVTTVAGNQLGVKETWNGGVEDNVMPP